MEIKNDLVMCVKNHYFNAALHSVCPICGSPAVGGPVAGSRMGNFVPTEKPGMGAPPAGGVGSFIPTEAPQGPGPVGYPAAPGATAPAGPWNSPGRVNPFCSPTVLGGNIASSDDRLDPVVGWVVCIEGPLRGTDWRLHAGYNYIGREAGDIHIRGDSQISREKHATVAYYDKTHAYYVGPAEGRNIIELNGEPVFSATQLNSRDIIKIGTTKLLFVPLCSDEFTWDQEKTDD